MKLKKKYIFITIIIVLLLAGGIWLKGELKIDSCLDQGGRWNYQTKQCEME